MFQDGRNCGVGYHCAAAISSGAGGFLRFVCAIALLFGCLLVVGCGLFAIGGDVGVGRDGKAISVGELGQKVELLQSDDAVEFGKRWQG